MLTLSAPQHLHRPLKAHLVLHNIQAPVSDDLPEAIPRLYISMHNHHLPQPLLAAADVGLRIWPMALGAASDETPNLSCENLCPGRPIGARSQNQEQDGDAAHSTLLVSGGSV